MNNRFQGGDVIELRRPKAPRVGAAAVTLGPTHGSLLDHLQGLGLIDLDQFATAIDGLTNLRRRCGQDAVHKQAAASFLAALVTLRCGLELDAVGSILEVAAADHDRLRRRP